jgi:hypothetical protein
MISFKWNSESCPTASISSILTRLNILTAKKTLEEDEWTLTEQGISTMRNNQELEELKPPDLVVDI